MPTSGRADTMIAAFQFNLTALSAVALIVGLFLIYNTVAMSVAARRAEIGMLQAVGAGRRTVLGLFLVEALVWPSWASLIGIPAGTTAGVRGSGGNGPNGGNVLHRSGRRIVRSGAATHCHGCLGGHRDRGSIGSTGRHASQPGRPLRYNQSTQCGVPACGYQSVPWLG